MWRRHPPRKVAMKYKRDLGGRVLPREHFLARWEEGRRLAAPLLLSSSTEAAAGAAGGGGRGEAEMDLNLVFAN